jgi:mediator of RNA polymerase II transcription subunit 10
MYVCVRLGANYTSSQSLIQNLVKLHRTAPSIDIDIPPDVTNYVENSRNPDIFTREFVETVQRANQMLKGRSDALQTLQEQIAWQLTSVIPELKEDVAKAVEATGGKVPI